MNEVIYSNIPVSNLPKVTYYVYLLAALAGSLESYYLWSTEFVIQ